MATTASPRRPTAPAARTVAAQPTRRRAAGPAGPSARPARRRVPARVRRRRSLLALVLVFAAALAVLAFTGAADATTPAPEAVTVVVADGETVWDLARAHVPAEAHLGSYVLEVIAHNDVDPTALRPGDVLHLPQR